MIAGAGYQIALLNQLTGDPGGLKRRRSTTDRRRSELLALAQTIRERSPGTDVIFLTFPGAEGMQAAAHAMTLESSRLTPDQLVELVHAVTDQRQQLTVATRGTRQLAELLQAVAQFGGSFELRKILTAACEALVELPEVQHAAVWLFPQDLSTGDIQIQAEHPRLGDESLAFRFASAPAVRRLVDTRAAVTVEDLTIGEELGTISERVKARDVTSVLLSPVFSRDRVLGCIALSTTGSRRAFRSDQIDVTQSFAALIAVALENGRLLDTTRYHNEHLEQLHRANLKLTTSFADRPTLLGRIIQLAVELVGATGGGIYSYEPHERRLTVVADFNRSGHLGKTLALGDGMAGRLVESGEPFLIVEDYAHWEGRSRVFDDAEPFGAVLEVALRWHGEVTGVLYVDDHAGRRFTPADAGLLQMFAESGVNRAGERGPTGDGDRSPSVAAGGRDSRQPWIDDSR